MVAHDVKNNILPGRTVAQQNGRLHRGEPEGQGRADISRHVIGCHCNQ